MSLDVALLVRLARIRDPLLKHVAYVAADYANSDGAGIYPSKSTLALDTGYSPDAVKRALKSLAKLGILRVKEFRGGGLRENTTVREFDLDLLRMLSRGSRKHGIPEGTHECRSERKEDGKRSFAVAPISPDLDEPDSEDIGDDSGDTSGDEDNEIADGQTGCTQPPLGVHTAPGAHSTGCTQPPGGVRTAPPRGAHSPPIHQESTSDPSTPPPPAASGGSARATRNSKKSTRSERRKAELEQVIHDLRTTRPQAEHVIATLFEPIIRQREILSPSPAYSLQVILDWVIERGLSDAEIAEIKDAVLSDRGAKVKPFDLEQAIQKVRRRRPKEGATINRSTEPEKFWAWHRWCDAHQSTNPDVRKLFGLLDRHNGWVVPFDFPPGHPKGPPASTPFRLAEIA